MRTGGGVRVGDCVFWVGTKGGDTEVGLGELGGLRSGIVFVCTHSFYVISKPLTKKNKCRSFPPHVDL